LIEQKRGALREVEGHEIGASSREGLRGGVNKESQGFPSLAFQFRMERVGGVNFCLEDGGYGNSGPFLRAAS